MMAFWDSQNKNNEGHSKMAFSDSQKQTKKHWLKQNFNMWIASTTTKKEYKGFFLTIMIPFLYS